MVPIVPIPMMPKPRHLLILTLVFFALMLGVFIPPLVTHYRAIANFDSKSIFMHSQPLHEGTTEVIIWGLNTLEPTTPDSFPVNRYHPDSKADVGWVVNVNGDLTASSMLAISWSCWASRPKLIKPGGLTPSQTRPRCILHSGRRPPTPRTAQNPT